MHGPGADRHHHVEELGIERGELTHDDFRDPCSVERCEEGGTRALLDTVFSLHALARIEREPGWYHEHGRLSSSRSEAVIETFDALCAELHPHARSPVEAFGVPERCPGRITE